jgi:hypothetical protein
MRFITLFLRVIHIRDGSQINPEKIENLGQIYGAFEGK